MTDDEVADMLDRWAEKNTDQVNDYGMQLDDVYRSTNALREHAQLLEASSAAAKAICEMDGALDEFSSHHPRPDGRPRTVLECVEEAMDTLRARIASLEAERMKLRERAEMAEQSWDTLEKENRQLREALVPFSTMAEAHAEVPAEARRVPEHVLSSLGRGFRRPPVIITLADCQRAAEALG